LGELMTKCKHEWRFLERWFTDDGNKAEYVFYCIHCLDVTSQGIEMTKKKS